MNPKLTKFLDDNKEMSLIGFGWAIFWRMYLVIFAVAFTLGFIGALID